MATPLRGLLHPTCALGGWWVGSTRCCFQARRTAYTSSIRAQHTRAQAVGSPVLLDMCACRAHVQAGSVVVPVVLTLEEVYTGVAKVRALCAAVLSMGCGSFSF